MFVVLKNISFDLPSGDAAYFIVRALSELHIYWHSYFRECEPFNIGPARFGISVSAPKSKAENIMCFICQIVPERVLKRLAADRKYSAEQRKNFADTIKIDTQLRRLRTQAARLTRVAGLIAEAPTVAPAPAITVYDCNHGQTLP